MHPRTIATQTDAEFVEQSTALMRDAITEAIAARGLAVVGLSGGSTPRPIYDTLGHEQGIEWDKVWLFLADDRYVRADSPHSNQFLLRSTLLKAAPIPESQLIFPDVSLPLVDCKALYEKHLSSLLRMAPADLITFGIGPDGHIASLFPPLSKESFGPSLVLSCVQDRFDIPQRISITLPTLCAARTAQFFLEGKKKKHVWEEMMKSAEGHDRWPAKAILEKVPTTVVTCW